MPPVKFVPGKPVDTTTPTVEVDTTGMTPGEYTFQLEVLDDAGKSEPKTVKVTVREVPVAKIAAEPTVAAPGKPITLNAAGSTPAGQIKTYHWTLLSATPAKK